MRGTTAGRVVDGNGIDIGIETEGSGRETSEEEVGGGG